MPVEEVISLLWKQAREEAIIQLKGLKEHCSEMSKQGEEIWLDDVKALEIAIKVLEKEPKTDILDKIKAEIEQEYNRLSVVRADETLELGECLGLKMSLKIIDKYKEG